MLVANNLWTGDFNRQIFYANSTGGTSSQIWNKPPNSKLIYITCIGGGGGGGAGRTGALNTGVGGGGGAASGYTTAVYSAYMLPDQLYVTVGNGGIGGTANGNGASGEVSFVSVRPDNISYNIIAKSGDAGAGGGAAGGSSTGGAGGTLGSAWTYTSFAFGSLGLIQSVPGQYGANGGSQISAGGDITISLPISGGAGGGGQNGASTAYNGGNILASGFFNGVSGGLNIGATGGGGFKLLPDPKNNLPMLFTGGAGGGATFSTTGLGGGGGNGSYGCGGGGGGSAYQQTGGPGGKGGDGIVIIVAI